MERWFAVPSRMPSTTSFGTPSGLRADFMKVGGMALSFGDLALAMPRHIARHPTPSHRMPNMDGILEAEFLDNLSGVIGVGVHAVALRRLGRAAVAAPVVGDYAIAVIEDRSIVREDRLDDGIIVGDRQAG
jgi:hypothetical protein